jgi:hypothetical protein
VSLPLFPVEPDLNAPSGLNELRAARRSSLGARIAQAKQNPGHGVGSATVIIERQLGHANLGRTSIYLQGIEAEEIISTVHTRRGPMMPASAGGNGGGNETRLKSPFVDRR